LTSYGGEGVGTVMGREWRRPPAWQRVNPAWAAKVSALQMQHLAVTFW